MPNIFRVRKLAIFTVLRLMLEPSINDLLRKSYCQIVLSGCVKQYFSSLLIPSCSSRADKRNANNAAIPASAGLVVFHHRPGIEPDPIVPEVDLRAAGEQKNVNINVCRIH